MAIDLTWRNVYVMVGMLAMITSLMFGATAAMIQWRLDALQHQLSDRLTAYQREIKGIERRIDNLEQSR